MGKDIRYQTFNPDKADEKWADLKNLKKAIEKVKDEIDLDSFFNPNADPSDFIGDVKKIDRYFGLVNNILLENPRAEEFLRAALIEVFKLETVPVHFPKRDEWLRIYTEMNKEKLVLLIKLLSKEMNWTEDEARGVIVEFLKELKPLIMDLKEDENTIIISEFDCNPKIDPAVSNQLLDERAKDHLEKAKRLVNNQ
ncbi:hypothetical protein GF391_01225 [Candidatus Uhrbacteria bacterium]|nr:hypothetical protein [Candidatus Uhrbacteria bacterium]